MDEDRAFNAPDSMTLQEAATLFTAGVTAWRVLNYGEPKLLGPESTILTQGTGGVSCYAIQVSWADVRMTMLVYSLFIRLQLQPAPL